MIRVDHRKCPRVRKKQRMKGTSHLWDWMWDTGTLGAHQCKKGADKTPNEQLQKRQEPDSSGMCIAEGQGAQLTQIPVQKNLSKHWGGRGGNCGEGGLAQEQIASRDCGISVPRDICVSAGQGDEQPALTWKLILFWGEGWTRWFQRSLLT